MALESTVAESDSPESTMRRAAELAGRLPKGSVIHLVGDLGAGKTCFTKGLAEGLGLDPDEVTSPTFAFVHVHAPASAGKTGLVHVDLYRLSEPSELTELGLDELPGDDSIAAVEWPERLEGRELPGVVHVRLEDLGGERRRIHIDTPMQTPPAGRIARGSSCS